MITATASPQICESSLSSPVICGVQGVKPGVYSDTQCPTDGVEQPPAPAAGARLGRYMRHWGDVNFEQTEQKLTSHGEKVVNTTIKRDDQLGQKQMRQLHFFSKVQLFTAVLSVFASDFGLDQDIALHIAHGLGAGIGPMDKSAFSGSHGSCTWYCRYEYAS